MNKRFTVEESNLISIFMEEGIDSDVGGRKKVINGIEMCIRDRSSLPMTQNNGWKPFRNTPTSQSWTQPPSTAYAA